MTLTVAYLSLGSNIGDRRSTLRTAVEGIDGMLAVSSLYETEPIGGVEQKSFYNIVVKVETARSAHQLLLHCQDLEQEAGRERLVRWGPRTLDVDVLLYGDLALDQPELTIPHPRMTERNFVMVPLLELAPSLGNHELLHSYDAAIAFGEVVNIGPL